MPGPLPVRGPKLHSSLPEHFSVRGVEEKSLLPVYFSVREAEEKSPLPAYFSVREPDANQTGVPKLHSVEPQYFSMRGHESTRSCRSLSL